MENKREMAQDCISLDYKYHSMIDCVSSQRPTLLEDAKLQWCLNARDMAEQLFKKRVEEIAYGEDE